MKTVSVVFEDLEITAETPSSVRFYLDQLSTDESKVYHVKKFEKTVTFRKYRMVFNVHDDFGPNTDLISGLNARMYESTSKCDNGEDMRREAGDAVILWGEVESMTMGGEVKFTDFPAELEDSLSASSKALETRGWLRFKSITVTVSDNSSLPRGVWDAEKMQGVLERYVSRTYEIYKKQNWWRNWHAVVEKYHWFVVPFYALNRGLVTPSACVALMHQFAGKADEVFYRNLVLVSMVENGMHPTEFLSAELGTDTYVRAIEVCMRALGIVPTIFPYASDTAREKHAASEEFSSLRRTKQGFEFQKQEKKQGRLTIDRATFDFYVNAFDCEDGSMTVYRIWLQLVRLKNVWRDPVVSKFAQIADRFVILILKVVCMGDTSTNEPAGEMCHILSKAVSRQYMSHMLANVPHNFRQYAKEVASWPDNMYFKSTDVDRIERAPPIKYTAPSRSVSSPTILMHVNVPGMFFHEECPYPHVWTIEPTTPTTNLHGTWDIRFSGAPMRGLRELSERQQSVEWWKNVIRDDLSLRKIPINSNYPAAISTTEALANPRTKNTSGFYNAYISAAVPGPAIIHELSKTNRNSHMFIDAVFSSSPNKFGVFHNELDCASDKLSLIPTAQIEEDELNAAFRAVQCGMVLSSPRAPYALNDISVPYEYNDKPVPVLLNPYDVDDESGSRAKGGAPLTSSTVPSASSIVRQEYPILAISAHESRKRVVYVVKK